MKNETNQESGLMKLFSAGRFSTGSRSDKVMTLNG